MCVYIYIYIYEKSNLLPLNFRTCPRPECNSSNGSSNISITVLLTKCNSSNSSSNISYYYYSNNSSNISRK